MAAIMNPNHREALRLATRGRLHERNRSTRTLMQVGWVKPIDGTRYFTITPRGQEKLDGHSSDTHETLT